jgi:hypothetical protein
MHLIVMRQVNPMEGRPVSLWAAPFFKKKKLNLFSLEIEKE